MTASRPFCVLVRWPDRKPVMLGTFSAPARASEHELDALAAREVAGFIAAHLPAGVEQPKIERVMSGQLVFVGDGL